MPRPDFTSPKAKKQEKTGNPFSAWLRCRAEMREKAEDDASKLITDNTAKNESTLVDTLAGIDFLHSRLPKEVLEKKTNPKQSCGDLEYASRAIQQMILKNPQLITIDLREVDKRLITIALMMKQAIEQGDERAAYAAKAALIRGIKDIRSKLPQNQPELSSLFVEANARYLDSWITLIGLAQVADRLKQNVDSQRSLYEAEEEKVEKSRAALAEKIQNDDELSIAFTEIVEHDAPEDRARWTNTQREVHRLMVERRMDGVHLRLKNLLLHQKELELTAKVGQIETLHAKVASLPIVADPNLLNQFQEQIDQLFQEMAASDAEIDETLRTMDDIDGRMAQMDQAPGSIRAREVASEEAERAVAEIQKMQEIETGETALRAAQMRQSLGIRTQEEQEAIRQEVEREMQEQMDLMMEKEPERMRIPN